MSTTALCPGTRTLREYLSGGLRASDRVAIREHVDECRLCRDALPALEPTWKQKAVEGEEGWTETEIDLTLTGGFDADEDDHNGPALGFRVERVAMVGQEEMRFLQPSNLRGSLGRIGEYEILGLLGRGGMGLVFKAFDASLSRVVAIKVLAPRLASSSQARRRFLREARAAAAINHANVVTIHGVGEQEGMPFLVMECIPGQSLRQRIKSGPPLNAVQVLRISLQVAQGLEAAQRQVVIHRDIKPANIMLEDNIERVKITDFGLARAAVAATDATSTDRIAGTPEYMSPEQVRGEKLDSRSDLFSLGCVMYAMVAGTSPFKGKHPLDSVRRVTEVTPPRLNDLDPSLPKGLADLVQRLLSKDAQDRPGTAGEVVEAIRQLLLEGGCLYDSAESDPGRVKKPTPARPLGLMDDDATEVIIDDIPKRQWRLLDVVMSVGAVLLLMGLALVLLAGAWLRERGTRGDGELTFEPRSLLGEQASDSAAAPVIRVSQGGKGDCRSLQQAIGLVTQPYTTIRIEDGETYDGVMEIKNSVAHRGLTIEGGTSPGQRPKLRGPGPRNAVLVIEGTRGVTLRGLEITSATNQYALSLGGYIPGLTIENVRFTKREPPGTEQWAHVWVSAAAQGDEEAPFRFVRCYFGPWMSGLVFQGNAGGLISWVEVSECRFEVRTRQVEVIQFVRQLKLERNLFLNASKGILLDQLTGASGDITIANNSFFRVNQWIDPSNSNPNLPGMQISRNAIFEVNAVDDPSGRLANMAEGEWQFVGNLWERGDDHQPEVDGEPKSESNVARAVTKLELLSRDLESPNFLRPDKGSALLTPALVGAIGER